jgi:tetratricopeptide (TPR) repeat protein
VVGGGGVGKTSLVVQWAHRVAPGFPGGALYLDLHGFDPGGTPTAATEAVRELLAALRVPVSSLPVEPAARLDLLRTRLAAARTLLVLDNVRDAEQIRPLFPVVPGCFVVAISRHHLGARPLTVDLLDDIDARELLLRRIGVDRVTAAAPEIVQRIIVRCAGLPLALSIAAAWAVARPRASLEELAEQLDPVRDIGQVLSWSIRTVTPAAARLLRLLALHPGADCGRAAAASLAGRPVRATEPLLTELRRASLLSETTPGRYALHDLLRAYLGGQPDRRAQRRLLDHLLHTAQTASRLVHGSWSDLPLPPSGPDVTVERLSDVAAANAWLDREHQALIAAVTVAVRAGLPAYAWDLAWTLTLILDTRGYWSEYLGTQLVAVRAADAAGDRAGQAHAHHGLGRALSCLGRDDEAAAELHAAAGWYEAIGDRAGLGNVHLGLGFLANRAGDHEGALAAARSALELFRSAGHRGGEAISLGNISWSLTELSRYEQAETFAAAALAVHEELGDPRGRAMAFSTIGTSLDRQGRHDDAMTAYRTGLALARQAADTYIQADLLNRIGDLRAAAGDRAGARDAWWESVTIFETMGSGESAAVRAKL